MYLFNKFPFVNTPSLRFTQSGFLSLHNLLCLTQKLYQTGLLASAAFFNTFGAVSSLAEAGLIYLDSDKAINLLWLEEEIKRQPHLTAQMATSCFRLFSSLSDKNYLKQAVNGSTVDFLLDRLATCQKNFIRGFVNGFGKF